MSDDGVPNPMEMVCNPRYMVVAMSSIPELIRVGDQDAVGRATKAGLEMQVRDLMTGEMHVAMPVTTTA